MLLRLALFERGESPTMAGADARRPLRSSGSMLMLGFEERLAWARRYECCAPQIHPPPAPLLAPTPLPFQRSALPSLLSWTPTTSWRPCSTHAILPPPDRLLRLLGSRSQCLRFSHRLHARCPFSPICRARNAQIDQQRSAISADAARAAREQEERLASLPVGVDTFRANQELRRAESASATSLLPDGDRLQQGEEEPHQSAFEGASASFAALGLEPHSIQDYATEYPEYADAMPPPAAVSDSSTALPAPPLPSDATAASASTASASSAAAAASSSASAGPGGKPSSVPPPPDESMGAEASLRYQKARLAVTLEELERLRALLAEKTARVASAEASVRELQQKAGLASRSERSLQAALEREKANNAEGVKRAAALERELSLLRKTDAEAAKKEKAQGADQRSKDVRLNRALEELERTKAQLRQLREEREGNGQGARAEAARLAAENTRLRKRQSELILAFKKQAKLIDVLKRQKLHVEAATMLSFTENEFSKTLELGETLALA